MSELLQHHTPECTGQWQRESAGLGACTELRCTKCLRTYPDTEQLRAAALAENSAGFHLHKLTYEGVAFLRKERP